MRSVNEPEHDGGCEDLVAQDVSGPHILQFRSPVYVAKWIDDRHVIVGGGGNNRFGMTNGLALLRVSPGSSSVGDGLPLWGFCGSVDLRGNILWCISNLYFPEDKENVGDAFFCLSHLDSFSLIRCRGLDPSRAGRSSAAAAAERPPSLVKICRVALVTDDDPLSGEPEKKPITIARGVVFAAQDDGTIAVFKLATLVSDAPMASSPFPAASKEGNDSFAAFSGRDANGKIDVTSRANDIASRPLVWDARSVILFVACKDKKIRIYQFNVEKFALSRKIELGEVSLGFKEGSFLRSSLRVCSSYEQQLPVTERHASSQTGAQDELLQHRQASKATGYDANVAICFVLLSLVEGQGYIQRVIITQKETLPKVDVPLCIGGEAPTAITHIRLLGSVRFTLLLVGTADGSVIEFLDQGLRKLQKRRVRRGIHVEPISAVAMSGSGGVVTTDIAQRIVISYNGIGSVPKYDAMWLFGAPRSSAFRRIPLSYSVAILLLILAVLMSLAVPFLSAPS